MHVSWCHVVYKWDLADVDECIVNLDYLAVGEGYVRSCQSCTACCNTALRLDVVAARLCL